MGIFDRVKGATVSEIDGLSVEEIIAQIEDMSKYMNSNDPMYTFAVNTLFLKRTDRATQRMLDATIKMESATQKMFYVAIASVVVSVLSLIVTLRSGCH